jgi:hypothetical protein
MNWIPNGAAALHILHLFTVQQRLRREAGIGPIYLP